MQWVKEQSACLPAWPSRAQGFELMTQGLEPFEPSCVPGRKRGQAGQKGPEEQRLGAKREIEEFSGKLCVWDSGQPPGGGGRRWGDGPCCRGKPGFLWPQDWGTSRRLAFI